MEPHGRERDFRSAVALVSSSPHTPAGAVCSARVICCFSWARLLPPGCPRIRLHHGHGTLRPRPGSAGTSWRMLPRWSLSLAGPESLPCWKAGVFSQTQCPSRSFSLGRRDSRGQPAPPECLAQPTPACGPQRREARGALGPARSGQPAPFLRQSSGFDRFLAGAGAGIEDGWEEPCSAWLCAD